MQLSIRLKAVADSVTKGNRVADVGCDHAYISIYLIENNIAPQVIAMDVNKGPLERAKENITLYGYEERIQTRLSDGLEKLVPGEADTILLAGMGGALMVRILTEGRAAVSKCTELVLQPQSELQLVRKYLHQIGYSIVEEHMVKDEGKFYTIIKAVISDAGTELYSGEVYYLYGKKLLEQGLPVVKEYLDREKCLRLEVVEALEQKPTDKTVLRLVEIRQELLYIEEAMKLMQKDDVNP
ncbi:SAM-dependent methyltransferase [Anaerocolumna cellulosilytica]|uniref:SAM-dependent methyltransferase n=1 Tax=Anaerocolumna cellulosilytica TaxID=433286 RepID=A0A6S6R208_9FIRM|nr:class I SAM-dependent methyltransferase [Anaerocolumna cellulosilytica]MBB5194406.1 tRNA (adenine22-N1)-methyltransferase [Anaerocolumna cellulosilytica]BCJ93350.1 SAM-dependent methyltransferase [Anaerocolumna cellulosilytica]